MSDAFVYGIVCGPPPCSWKVMIQLSGWVVYGIVCSNFLMYLSSFSVYFSSRGAYA